MRSFVPSGWVSTIIIVLSWIFRLLIASFYIQALMSKGMREGRLPNTDYRRLITHSYLPYVGWALHLNFSPYQFPWHGSGTTHFSANRYDRHTPLELFGVAFAPATYHGVVAPVDISGTFAFLLRINRPSAAVGRVLTEVIRPEGTD
jgi:hypothetical protein